MWNPRGEWKTKSPIDNVIKTFVQFEPFFHPPSPIDDGFFDHPP